VVGPCGRCPAASRGSRRSRNIRHTPGTAIARRRHRHSLGWLAVINAALEVLVPRRVHGSARTLEWCSCKSCSWLGIWGSSHLLCQIGTAARGDGRPCAPAANGSVWKAASGGDTPRDTWGTVEAGGQGRSTECTSRYEANGILTGASDDIALDLIREGGNRAVGLAFRRTRKDRPSVNNATCRATWAAGVRPGTARGRVVLGSAVDRVHGAGLCHDARLIVVAEQSATLDPDGRSRHPDDRGYRRTRLPGPHPPRRTGARSPRTLPHRNQTPGSHSPFR
jgi:hypothetical protein